MRERFIRMVLKTIVSARVPQVRILLPPPMYYVYILYSRKLRKKYIGFTRNIKTRIEEHNLGKVPFTKTGKPWQLIFYEGFSSKADAINEERFFKSGQGRERIKYLFSDTLNNLVGSAP